MAASKNTSGGKKSNAKGKGSTSSSGGAGRSKSTARKSSSTKKGTSKSTGKNTKQHRRTAEEINTYRDQMAFETGITIMVGLILAMFFYLSFFGVCGKVGVVITGVCFGVFGWIAWLIPAYCIVGYTFAVVNSGDKRVPRRLISAGVFGVVLDTLVELLAPKEILTEYFTSNHVLHHGYFECLYMSFEDVAKGGRFNGGIVGRFIGDMLSKLIGKWGAAAVLFAILLLCVYIFYGLEMMASLRKRNAYQQEMEEAYDQFLEDEEDYREPSYRVLPASRPVVRRNVRAGRAGGFQSVNLKEAGKRLDELEKGKVSEIKETSASGNNKGDHAVASQGKSGQILSVELLGEGAAPKQGKAEKKVTPEPEKKHNSRTKAESSKSVDMVEEPKVVPEKKAASQIPIYREEMNQKFGRKVQEEEIIPEVLDDARTLTQGKGEKPMKSFAPKPKEIDIRPSSQVESGGGAGKAAAGQKKSDTTVEKPAATEMKAEQAQQIPYEFPPIDLLSLPKNAVNGVSDDKLRQTALRLQSTLESFGVDVEMGAVTCGPTVTRYEVLPAQGVRVNKITNLADDLKLSLAAPSIRIEAPIPGKSAVGIEVPNDAPSAVHFRELLEGDAFEKAKSPVTFAVGKDIAGKVIVTDIAKMPHLLIAGATGSGKSVCINTLIMRILYKSDPNEVKLIMIDPKVVELSCYNGIPHLFCPVVTDPKEAAASLNWAVREMMDRYNKFKELGVRNIAGYNEKIKTVENAAQAGYAHMPLLVIIVDEFADLMMVASKDVEDAVCRLAQLARAAGIHLILATQRPSVNVITGVIKANIPSRIAFSVSSAIDSRTILDKAGAEKLLGKGDMLFFPSGYSEPVRLQGAFVSDKEVSDVVAFLCDHNDKPVYNSSVTEIVDMPSEAAASEENASKPDRDEYFEDAARFVIESDRAAAGQLQRRFSIGFNRAGRIIDQLHKAGVVGPAVGTKPRQVLMSMEEFEAFLAGGESGGDVSEEELAALEAELMESTEETV